MARKPTKGEVDDATDDAVSAAARAGFAARGVLYAIVGVLVVQLALGGGGEDASQQGAMESLASQPFGGFLLGLVATGLAGYALFRFVQAVRGHGDGGALKRHGVPAVRGTVNAGLSFLAWSEVLGSGGSGGGSSESSVTARILGLPGGPVLIAAVGLIIVGVGVKQLVEAKKGDVNELSSGADLPAGTQRMAHNVGRLGYVGRGLVFLLTGGFLVRAAFTSDPEEGVGLDAALQEVVDAPFGTPLLLFVAVCLVLFGAHCLIEARYARREASSSS